MRFLDVYRVEGNLLLVVVVEFIEGRNLPPEGRSGIASKNQYDGLLLAKRRQLYQ